MIKLTRFDNKGIVLNAELIEQIEQTPDTVIKLTNGKKILVKETEDEIIEKTIIYKRKIHSIAVT